MMRLLSAIPIVVAAMTSNADLPLAQSDVMYFGAYTPTGKPTAKPYSNCEHATLGSRVLWACPSQRDGRQGRRAGSQGSGGAGSSSGASSSGSGMGGAGSSSGSGGKSSSGMGSGM
jgi:uncharacterized membrane protein YgcG